jgi:RNA polymerase sigma factor (sigma-70 family)
MLASDPSAMGELVLVRRAIGGDTPALAMLARRLMPVIRSRVRRALSRAGARMCRREIDDLVHDVWVELLAEGGRRLRSYDPRRGVSLAGWVAILADREIRSALRRASAEKRGGAATTVPWREELVCDAADPESTVIAEALATRLRAALEGTLAMSGRRVLELSFGADLPSSEVARRMGVSVQVVYNWQHRIRTTARRLIAG